MSDGFPDPPSDASASPAGEEAPFRTDDPFAPPADYAFEPELEGPAPREIPELVLEGSWARSHRLTIQVLTLSGGICGLLSTVPGVRELGVYFVPLHYLHWIAFGLIAIAGGMWVWGKYGASPLRYVEQGIPSAGRILSLTMQPSQVVNGQPTQYCFWAQVELLHPDTGEHVVAEVKSTDFSADKRLQYDTTYRVGDYATLVHLPSKTDETLNLYGFLGLAPELGVVKVGKPTTFLEAAAAVVFFVVFLGLLFWNVHALQAYDPLRWSFADLWIPAVVGAVVLGGGLLLFFVLQYRNERRELANRNLKAFTEGRAVELGSSAFFAQTGLLNRGVQLIVIVGAPFLGGLIGAALGISANALLDEGPARAVPVEVLEAYEESHAFVFKQYYAEYKLADDPEGPENVRKLYTSPDYLPVLFGEGPFVAEVRPGHFGWEWIETVRPVDGAIPEQFSD